MCGVCVLYCTLWCVLLTQVCGWHSVCAGETIGEAAIRETLEETGIQCEFVSVMCFRHMTAFRFGCDDIYFVCHLRPLSDNITIDKNEIANCKWISVSASMKNVILRQSLSPPLKIW